MSSRGSININTSTTVPSTLPEELLVFWILFFSLNSEFSVKLEFRLFFAGGTTSMCKWVQRESHVPAEGGWGRGRLGPTGAGLSVQPADFTSCGPGRPQGPRLPEPQDSPRGGKCDPSGWPSFNRLCLFLLSFHTTEARLLPCAWSHWASVKSVFLQGRVFQGQTH